MYKRHNAILQLLEKENHGTYGASLLDVRWKQKRLQILERDGHQCVNCGVREALQVHHRQYHFQIRTRKYKEPWDYHLYSLVLFLVAVIRYKSVGIRPTNYMFDYLTFVAFRC